MCNLYSMTKPQDAIRAIFRVVRDRTGNLPPMPGIFPDYPAPIIRLADGDRELTTARWGMPSPVFALKGKGDAAGRLFDGSDIGCGVEFLMFTAKPIPNSENFDTAARTSIQWLCSASGYITRHDSRSSESLEKCLSNTARRSRGTSSPASLKTRPSIAAPRIRIRTTGNHFKSSTQNRT